MGANVETSGFGQREGDRGLRPPGVTLGRRLGKGTIGELVGSWHEKVGFHSFIHHPPARLQVFPIYRAQLLPNGIYYNAPQLL